MSQIQETATTLHNARKNRSEIEPFSKEGQALTMDQAYQVQAEGVKLRLQDQETVVGYKMGLTSKAKMEQMGLSDPIYGVLTQEMQFSSSYNLGAQIHPKAEPEVYIRTQTELSGQPSLDEVEAACSDIGLAIEILDSRYTGFKYFQLPDVVADNSSSSHYCLGEAKPLKSIEDRTQMNISIGDGKDIFHETKTSAVLGDPLISVQELVKLLNQSGKTLPANSLVLTGAATVAIPLSSSQTITAKMSGFADLNFEVKG